MSCVRIYRFRVRFRVRVLRDRVSVRVQAWGSGLE